MPVNLNLPSATPVRGAVLTTLVAGLKSSGTADMVIVQLAETARTAAVFTSNAFCAAPVTVAREQLLANQGRVRALLINSGNANAGTGQPGITMARGHCQALAKALAIPENSVLPFSTGVIGQLLPDAIMLSGIERGAQALAIASDLQLSQWTDASRGIMTTDTQPKLTSQTVTINGKDMTITGMAKGAGMIQPDMATMLSYIFTDAAIDTPDLNKALLATVDVSFNAITVDSDTSTNDACVLVATGAGEALNSSQAEWPVFMQALSRVCMDLAQAIIRDAEGATKFITVKVTGGRDTAECKQVGYSIANSPLVKTAMFASDANVGRLLMAIGKAGVESLDASQVTVSLGDVVAFREAGIAEGYTEARGAAILAEADIDVIVDLARGDATASIYTCDLSHDYVSINADYRS